MSGRFLGGSVSLSDRPPLPLGGGQFPLEYCGSNRAFKLEESVERVLLGVCDGDDEALLESLSCAFGKRVEFVLLDPADFAATLGRMGAGGADGGARASARAGFALDAIMSDAPIVNYVNGILIDAIRAGASDIHFESFASGGTVRFRIDGGLAVVDSFPAERFAAVATRVKIMANLNIMERRQPQDGRLTVDSGGASVDMRVSIVPITNGESIVLRLLGRSSAGTDLDSLGMDERTSDWVRKVLANPHGMVLATGPTGSGKTTTLNAMIKSIRDPALKIITIEDPVEYAIDGVNQIQTNEQIKLTFDVLLRRVLRQDPDVIMIGEIRDQQTAELAVRAALTGHLVLSTLHTNDSISAVARLRNLGVEPFLVGGTLRGALAQRLVRRACPECSTRRVASAAEKAVFAHAGIKAGRIPKANGCPKCRKTGYASRFALFEHFRVDPDIEEMISRGERTGALEGALAERGYRRLAAMGLEAVTRGDTTFEEIEREIGA